ncbi:MAG: hypothetical protein PHY29_02775 [Syntrophales bacterium]|nr:hypothetical protein [Syntrophales bacterium]
MTTAKILKFRRITVIEVKWVDDPRRISSLFIRVHGAELTVDAGPLGAFAIQLIDGEDGEQIKTRISEALAGQPLRATEEIIASVIN